MHGNALVPAKALCYKKNEETGEIIERIKPRTHKFENGLKDDLKKELDGVGIFPTKKEVLVSIIHGVHNKKAYSEIDLDNRAKSVLDALKGVVYFDDSQVKILWTDKRFLQKEQESYFQIAIKILSEKIIKHISDEVA